MNIENDKERKLKQISPQSAEELFKIFGLKGIVCDKNNDGVIIKEELQCLNYIWKYYVPEDIWMIDVLWYDFGLIDWLEDKFTILHKNGKLSFYSDFKHN